MTGQICTSLNLPRRGKAAATVAIEASILEIVAERAPITVRGIAYALFTRGLIDTSHIAFYVGGAAFFVFLTVKSLEARKWR